MHTVDHRSGRQIRVGLRSVLVAALLAGALATPASAGPPWPYPPAPSDTAKVGIHVLVDTAESPNVRCLYTNSGALKGLRIRRPIAFARDAGAGLDSQTVGWRYQVYGQRSSSDYAFELVAQGPLRKATATDRQNAHFLAASVDLPLTEHEVYRVRHIITWYRPSDPGRQAGKAIHWAQWYEVNTATLTMGTDWCYQTRPKLPAEPPPPGHTGTFGTHLLVDSHEYPGLTCYYSRSAPYPLLHMDAAPAIAFAANTTPGVDRRTIKRRLLVQYADEGGPDPAWTTLRTTKPVERTATEERNAVFPKVRLPVADGPAHLRWRVVQRLIWTSPTGRADETARYTLQDDGDAQVGGPDCGGQD